MWGCKKVPIVINHKPINTISSWYFWGGMCNIGEFDIFHGHSSEWSKSVGNASWLVSPANIEYLDTESYKKK